MVRRLRPLLPIVALLAAAEPAGAQGSDRAVCTVQRVVDGDTIRCREGRAPVRLLLIDAPERGQGRYYGQARAHLEALVPVGTRVELETDVRQRDRYDRVLAYVWTQDGRMANEEMARSGFAVPYVFDAVNVRYVERIREAAAEARRERRGLWAEDAFSCSPRDFRAGRCTPP